MPLKVKSRALSKPAAPVAPAAPTPRPPLVIPPLPPGTASYDCILHLDQIVIDYEWNSRSKAHTLSSGTHVDPGSGDEDAPDLPGLAKSLELDGQLSRVEGRIRPDGRVDLVAGFRRCSAVGLLRARKAAVRGLGIGEVKATVYAGMTELEARRLNMVENAPRKNVSGPDFVFGIRDWLRLDKKVTEGELSEALARSIQHVSMAMALAKKLHPDVFKAWRDSAVRPLAIFEIYPVALLEPEKQMAEYTRLLSERVAPIKHFTSQSWELTAAKRAIQVGSKWGAFEREGFILVRPEIDWVDAVREALWPRNRRVGKGAKHSTLVKLGDAMRRAYEEERARPIDKGES